MDDDALLDYCVPHLKRMFPQFERSWIQDHHVWRARYAQPVVVPHYSSLIPPAETPLAGLYLCSMAQVYPEDRGTNYAIREGRRVAGTIAQALRATERMEGSEVSAATADDVDAMRPR
jgi:protoporphyrinogen oxidase